MKKELYIQYIYIDIYIYACVCVSCVYIYTHYRLWIIYIYYRIHFQLMTYPQEVPVDIIIKPIVYYNIPCAVIVSKWSGVPPVLEKKDIIQRTKSHNRNTKKRWNAKLSRSDHVEHVKLILQQSL